MHQAQYPLLCTGAPHGNLSVSMTSKAPLRTRRALRRRLGQQSSTRPGRTRSWGLQPPAQCPPRSSSAPASGAVPPGLALCSMSNNALLGLLPSVKLHVALAGIHKCGAKACNGQCIHRCGANACNGLRIITATPNPALQHADRTLYYSFDTERACVEELILNTRVELAGTG